MKRLGLIMVPVVVSAIYLLLGNLGEASALVLKDNYYDKWDCCGDLNKDAEAKTGDIEQHGKQNSTTNQICIAFNCKQKIVVDQNYNKNKGSTSNENKEYNDNDKYTINIYIDYN